MKNIKKPKGTDDILSSEVFKWNFIEEEFKSICNKFAFDEIRTPTFEFTDLFKRGVGETTDIVNKEMFNIEQRQNVNGKSTEKLTLKPEGTAPVVRALIENSLFSNPQPIKLFYNTPCFRYEQPQKGRLREFHQLGAEVFGSQDSYTDAELISLVYNFFENLGVADKIKLKINSIGTKESRQDYADKLRDFLKPQYDNLCSNCKERYEKNPLRILDCKIDNCKEISKGAPLMIDNLDEESKVHFESLKKYLDIMGIEYEVDPYIVRGLDYYVKTAFEFVTDFIGSQATVCGGGRYDNLVKELGGPETSGVGFAIGIERLLLLMEEVKADFPDKDTLDIFIIAMGDLAKDKSIEVCNILRKNGISCDLDHMNRSFKAQMKYANKISSKYVIIIGENEINENKLVLKNMANSEQIEYSFDSYVDEIKKLL